MKKNYFSPHRILVLVLFLSFVIIYSCRKESVPKTVVTDSKLDKSATLITQAKAYLDSTLKINSTTIKLSSTKRSSGPATFKGYLFWDKAKSFTNKNYKVVEVPAALDYKQVNFYKLGGDTINHADKSIVENAFVRVLIFKDSIKNILDKQIITYIPDKKYLLKNANPSTSNWINSIDKNYSGYIEYRTWENIPFMVLRLDDGKVSSKYALSQQVDIKLKPQSLKVNLLQCNTVIIDNYIMVCIGSSCTTTYTGSTTTTVCTGSADFVYGSPAPVSNVGSTGGGGNNGTTGSTLSDADIANAIPIIDDNDPIDPKKYVNCFTDGKTAKEYKLTLYVDQPVQGSNSSYNTPNYLTGNFRLPDGRFISVGHAFVGFEKINTDNTSVTQVMGFYPGGNVIRSHGVIKDDSGHNYSVSYTSTVNAAEFNAALQLVVDNGNLAYYQLSTVNGINEYNCTDAAIHWMWEAKVDVPSGTSNKNLNVSPGQYGQDLRSKSGTNTKPGNAPNSHGPCN